MFRTSKRTLERQLPFRQKYAVELKAINQMVTYISIGLVTFALGFIMGGAI